MVRLWRMLEDGLNNLNIRKKLLMFYLCCVLIPLVITDSVILWIQFERERRDQWYDMESIASAVQFDINYAVDEAAGMMNRIYPNSTINTFLNRSYRSGLEYWIELHEVLKLAAFESGNIYITIYADNDTMLNGGHFYRLSDAVNEEWYLQFQESEKDILFTYSYIGNKMPTAQSHRKLSLIRRLNYYRNSDIEKIIKVDLDYSTMVRRLTGMKFRMPVYICSGERILYSNVGYSSNMTDFESLTGEEKIGYELEWSVYGTPLRILVIKPEIGVIQALRSHAPLILLLIAVNIILPWLLTTVINRSFTSRLRELNHAFDTSEGDNLSEISPVRGKDEIANLMRHYNQMAERTRELIKRVYTDRLERQEMDIARQKAELLALQSQINPHFLFNVLESIRMHSILKGEQETAEMIARLAVLERQSVNWSADSVTILEEVKFIEAYLELQQYRFGSRFRYEIMIEPDCGELVLPKLTLVTFVENACVHGVEKKSVSVWVYVRVYRKNGFVCLEVEDTGGGMEDDEVKRYEQDMNYCSLDMLREKTHVGMVNACLRLKMMTQGAAKFELESEKGIGTTMIIKIPQEAIEQSGVRETGEEEESLGKTEGNAD